jgi:hypothetical protein
VYLPTRGWPVGCSWHNLYTAVALEALKTLDTVVAKSSNLVVEFGLWLWLCVKREGQIDEHQEHGLNGKRHPRGKR